MEHGIVTRCTPCDMMLCLRHEFHDSRHFKHCCTKVHKIKACNFQLMRLKGKTPPRQQNVLTYFKTGPKTKSNKIGTLEINSDAD